MDCNREEALRAKEMAEKKMENKDFSGALKIAQKAQQLYPDLENVSQMIVVCEVHCSAENKIYNSTTDKDWYSILKIEPSADDLSIKKQYRKLALVLHPDKNKFSGSADAFKLIGEAQRVLLDREKRMIHDSKRKAFRNFSNPKPNWIPNPRPNVGHHPWTQSNFTQGRSHFPNNYNTTGVHSVNLQNQGVRQTFWTACPFCHIRFQYYRDDAINKLIDCQNCNKSYSAYETNVQAAAAGGTNQRPFFFPQQNKAPPFTGSGSMNHNFTSKPVFPGNNYHQPKETSKAAEVKVNRKRKKKVEESSGSDDSTSSSEEEDFVPKEDGNEYPSHQYFSEQPRRSTRSKRNISYRENLSDNDDDDDEKSVEKTLPKEDKKKESNPNSDSSKLRETVKEDGKEEEPEVYECPDPDFSDFDKDRREDSFTPGQIWAVYDNEDAMPRFYALIKKVLSPGFKLQIAWLEFIPANNREWEWIGNDLPVSCGKFKPGKSEKAEDLPMFSHLVSWGHKCVQGETYDINPKAGETWALFKNWNVSWSSATTLDDTETYKYDFVEILSDYDENVGVRVSYLEKVKSFTCLFCQKVEEGAMTVIPPVEKLRFSHRVPSCRMTGEEREGVPKGSYELDPASLPTSTFEQVFL